MVLHDSHAVPCLEITHACLHLLFPQIHFSKSRNFKLNRKSEFGLLCLIFNFHHLFLFYGFKMLKNILIFLHFFSALRGNIPTATASRSIINGTVGFCDNEDKISGSTRVGNYCNG